MILTDTVKSLWSSNPIPRGCVLYAPLWALRGDVFRSVDYRRHKLTNTGSVYKVGEGRTFDGTDDLIAANTVATTVNFGDAHTIIAWAKRGTQAGADVVVGVGELTTTQYAAIQFNNTTSKFVATNSVTGASNTVNSLNTYSDTNWHFLAMVVNASGHITIFDIDGVAQGTSTNNADLSVINDAFYIGQLPYTSANVNPWAGTIGEVLVYSRAFTVGELTKIRLLTKWRYS